MNIEAYNLDSLRKLVRSLQDENKRLKVLLDKADIAYEPETYVPTRPWRDSRKRMASWTVVKVYSF